VGIDKVWSRGFRYRRLGGMMGQGRGILGNNPEKLLLLAEMM